MPRKASAAGITSAFHQVQQQARALLVNLRRDIRTTENELKRLKEEESRLSVLVGVPAAHREAAVPAARKRGARINWRTVLQQMPKQFKASDIRSARGLGEKRPSEIFAAITRWINAGLAKRKTRGLYEKTAS